MEHLGRANMLGELVSALAHEINQPLAAILSNAQAARRLLASGSPDPGELREILDDIVRDDKRAGEVIQHLRLMLRKGEIQRERFRIQESIGEVLGLMNGELDAQGISVDKELDPDLPPAEAGRVETQQVIMNLLINAAHALSESPPGQREIRIRAERHVEDAVMVSIEDTGPGIAPEALSSAFEPFFTTRSDGLGMGLAICRRIVEAHGGRIWGENAINGARFSFTLPLAGPERIDD
jgi:signal transduction histidine kinase